MVNVILTHSDVCNSSRGKDYYMYVMRSDGATAVLDYMAEPSVVRVRRATAIICEDYIRARSAALSIPNPTFSYSVLHDPLWTELLLFRGQIINL